MMMEVDASVLGLGGSTMEIMGQTMVLTEVGLTMVMGQAMASMGLVVGLDQIMERMGLVVGLGQTMASMGPAVGLGPTTSVTIAAQGLDVIALIVTHAKERQQVINNLYFQS